MKKIVLCAALLVMSCGFAFGQTYKVLYSFGSSPNDGAYPLSSLISDSAGNLYGTTINGGANNAGTAFELSPQVGGSWNETILYNFCSQANCTDGKLPLSGLVMDAVGNFYGTASLSNCTNGEGQCGGTIFELSPPSVPGGAWMYTVLYTFCSIFINNACQDGSEPNSQLVFDASGNLYGTSGGGFGGVVFELSPDAGGWTESVLYYFCSKKIGMFCTDGEAPKGGVGFDKSGNLYGTTQHGGRYRIGVLFELSPGSEGWAETVLNNFYLYGSSVSPVSFDAAGNLYSTTQGDAFQLNLKTHTQRSRQFTDLTGASDAGVLIDPVRNALFGTGVSGIWEVTPSRQLVSIYAFCSRPNCADGGASKAGLIEDAKGNLYGTTEFGGAAGNGVVFEVTP